MHKLSYSKIYPQIKYKKQNFLILTIQNFNINIENKNLFSSQKQNKKIYKLRYNKIHKAKMTHEHKNVPQIVQV